MDAAETMGAIWAAGAAVVSALASSAVTLLVTRKPAEVTANAAIQTAINDGFAKLSARYEARDQALVAEITALRGDVEALTTHLDGVEGALRERGLPIPPRPPRQTRPPLLLVAGR